MPCIWKPEGKNVVATMVLPPTIKVLNLPTVYAMYMEAGGKNVVTAMVLLPTFYRPRSPLLRSREIDAIQSAFTCAASSDPA